MENKEEKKVIDSYINLNSSKAAAEIVVALINSNTTKATILAQQNKPEEALEVLKENAVSKIICEYENWKHHILFVMGEDGQKDITKFIKRKVGINN